MNNKVIYTCVTGGYDIIKQPKVVYDDFDYICFTNDVVQPKIGVWEIRPIPVQMKDLIRLSRYVKIMPHAVLQNYDYSCYIDMNVIVNDDMLKNCIENKIAEGIIMSMPKHPEGCDCVYKESHRIIYYNREGFWPVVRQIQFLHREGYPRNNGMYENNIIFRKHNDLKVIAISELWWKIYCKYTRRDQLSLVYVLWKLGITPKPPYLLPEGISTQSGGHFSIDYQHTDRRQKKQSYLQQKYATAKRKGQLFCLKYLSFLLD